MRRSRKLCLTRKWLPEIPEPVVYRVESSLGDERHLPGKGPKLLVELHAEVDPSHHSELHAALEPKIASGNRVFTAEQPPDFGS